MRFAVNREVEIIVRFVRNDFYGITFRFVFVERKSVFHVHFQRLARRNDITVLRCHNVFAVYRNVESLEVACEAVCEVGENADYGYDNKQYGYVRNNLSYFRFCH